MRLPLAALALAVSALSAEAQDCPEFGLTSRYLTDLYCSELRGIVSDGVLTRGMGDAPAAAAEPPPEGEPWAEIEIIREAYRADPKKTLALIARIRNAGGLVEKQ